MTFDEALREMRYGAKVRRPMWTTAYLFIGKDTESDTFDEYIYCGNVGSDRVYKIRAVECSNIMSHDWETIDETKSEPKERKPIIF